jgi:hypothetical protein
LTSNATNEFFQIFNFLCSTYSFVPDLFCSQLCFCDKCVVVYGSFILLL